MEIGVQGSCQGSYICKNPKCSKLQCEDTINTIDFKREGEGIRTCGSCGQLVKHTYCGAIKVIEYNKSTGYTNILAPRVSHMHIETKH